MRVGAAYHARAATTATEIIERAETTANKGACIAGNFAAGCSGVHLGTLAIARRHLEEAIRGYRGATEAEATQLAFDCGVEQGAPTYAYASWCLWLLGYPDQALHRDEEALAVVERIRHAYTYSRARYWSSALHAYRREWPVAKERAAAAIASAQERGLAMMVAVGGVMLGAARAMLEPSDAAAAEIQAAMTAYRATGARFQTTYQLVLYAQALAACGRQGEGLAALREAAAMAEETGERYFEAEIHRVEGNLRLAENGTAEAEACYLKALAVARAQEARSLELRAARDLARLWAERGEHRRAADLLAPVYGWFTEGFDTPDLQEAKALLDDLHA